MDFLNKKNYATNMQNTQEVRNILQKYARIYKNKKQSLQNLALLCKNMQHEEKVKKKYIKNILKSKES